MLVSELFPIDVIPCDEISSYLAYPVDREADPIAFWEEKKLSFKILSKLALRILVRPALAFQVSKRSLSLVIR